MKALMHRKQNFAKVAEAKMQQPLEQGHCKPYLPCLKRHAAKIGKENVFSEQMKTKERKLLK